MTRKALLFPLLLCAVLAVRAQSPDSPTVEGTLLQSIDPARRAELSGAGVERIAEGLAEPQRAAAREGLLALEPKASDATLDEIARGYLALGFPQDAARLARLLPSGPRAALLSRAAVAFNASGDADAAAAASKEVLALDPSDKAAEAVLKLSERKVGKKEIALLRSKPSFQAVATAVQPAVAVKLQPARPLQRPAFLPKIDAYHMPDTKPPSTWQTLRAGVGSLWDVYWYKPSAEHQAGMRKLKDTLTSTETGAALIKEMGGWERVDKEVLFMFSKMPGDGTAAFVRPMAPWETEKTGKKYVMAVNRDFIKDKAAVVVPVFGHELRHIADKMEGYGDMNLAVTSEHGAHLDQVYLLQELEKKLTPQEKADLNKNRMWLYQKWVASMWEDHLLKLYPKKEDYQKAFEGSKNLQYLAGLAYEDIVKKAVKDGTPQVHYHVSDLYANATHEPEVTEAQLLKAIAAEADPARRRQLESLLVDLKAMRKRIFETDDAYRRRTGQTLS